MPTSSHYFLRIQRSLPPSEVRGLRHSAVADTTVTRAAWKHETHDCGGGNLQTPLGDVEGLEWIRADPDVPQLWLQGAVPAPARITSHVDDHVELHRDQVLATLETYDNLVKRRMQDVDGTVSSQQLHEALDLAIAANMSWGSNRGTPPRTSAP